MNVLECGHIQKSARHDICRYDDEDHVEFVGEFYFSVNKSPILPNHNIYNHVAFDRDAHRSLVVHFTPSDMSHGETNT